MPSNESARNVPNSQRGTNTTNRNILDKFSEFFGQRSDKIISNLSQQIRISQKIS